MSLFFKIYGVPDKMVIDGSKEHTLGSFRKKRQEADFHINQIELYSLWQLQAGGIIRYMNKGSGRKMVLSAAPKRMWDDALEFEAYVK